MRASAAEMDFQNMQANLKAAGYKKRNVTISSKRAAILGGLSVLPLVADRPGAFDGPYRDEILCYSDSNHRCFSRDT